MASDGSSPRHPLTPGTWEWEAPGKDARARGDLWRAEPSAVPLIQPFRLRSQKAGPRAGLLPASQNHTYPEHFQRFHRDRGGR